MSGYVISIKLFAGYNEGYLREAFTRRYFRLMIPALGSVVIAYVLMKAGFMHNIQLAMQFGEGYVNGWLGKQYNFMPSLMEATRTGVWDTFFVFASDWDRTYSTSLWTMNPELYGSLFCFFVFGIYGTHTKRFLIYPLFLGLSLLLNLYWLCVFLFGFILSDIDHSETIFRKPITWLEQFLSKSVLIPVSVLILLVCLKSWEQVIPIEKVSRLSFIKMSIGVLTVLTITKSKALRSIFQTTVLRFLGRISFSVHLLHVSIICSVGCYCYLLLDTSLVYKVIISSLVSLFVTVALSFLYEKYIDAHAVRFARRIGKSFNSNSDASQR